MEMGGWKNNDKKYAFQMYIYREREIKRVYRASHNCTIVCIMLPYGWGAEYTALFFTRHRNLNITNICILNVCINDRMNNRLECIFMVRIEPQRPESRN